MVKKLFWFLVGGILGVFIYHLVLNHANLTIDSNILVNIVIASAACIATYLTSKQIDIQRQNRIWDLNKDILLDLSYNLSKRIINLSNIIESAYQSLDPNYHGIDDEDYQFDKEAYEKVEIQINNLLNVYKPLIGSKLTDSLIAFQETEKEIRRQVFEKDLDAINAYEDALTKLRNLA